MYFPLEPFSGNAINFKYHIVKFQSLATAFGLDSKHYNLKFSMSLKEMTYQIYERLPIDEKADFQALICVLRLHYQLDSDSYQRRFHSAMRDKN